tara:strand:- start:395 stop:592 length:198 start_codon:yes stop_codon:yes gene_type:complete
MITTEFSYHIYAKGEVLFYNLNEDDFNVRWNILNSMCGPSTPLGKVADLSFERVLSLPIKGEDSY